VVRAETSAADRDHVEALGERDMATLTIAEQTCRQAHSDLPGFSVGEGIQGAVQWNATTRDSQLRMGLTSLDQARAVINQWLHHYNRMRPDQALSIRLPVPESPYTSSPQHPRLGDHGMAAEHFLLRRNFVQQFECTRHAPPLGHNAGLGAAFIGSLTTFISLPLGCSIGRLYDGGVLPLVTGFAILGGADWIMETWAQRDTN